VCVCVSCRCASACTSRNGAPGILTFRCSMCKLDLSPIRFRGPNSAKHMSRFGLGAQVGPSTCQDSDSGPKLGQADVTKHRTQRSVAIAILRHVSTCGAAFPRCSGHSRLYACMFMQFRLEPGSDSRCTKSQAARGKLSKSGLVVVVCMCCVPLLFSLVAFGARIRPSCPERRIRCLFWLSTCTCTVPHSFKHAP
jgi:hypothetical protein